MILCDRLCLPPLSSRLSFDQNVIMTFQTTGVTGKWENLASRVT